MLQTPYPIAIWGWAVFSLKMMLFPNLPPAMNLTLAIPSLNRQSDESVPSLTLPAFNRLLRFGHLHRQAVETSKFYGRYLWNGSLLEHAKTASVDRKSVV